MASVDIGTNSVLLLVVQRDADGGLRRLEEQCLITRLGQNVDRSGQLAPAAVQRTVEALRSFAETMERLDVQWRGAVGTAVLRDAADAGPARRAMEQELGCELQIISGQREARLVLAGVRGSLGRLEPGSLVFDVGGGSTELILCGPGAEPGALISLELGSVRMTERLLAADPPPAAELTTLRQAVAAQLAQLPSPPWGVAQQLVGIAGTVTTLATIQLGLRRYDSEQVNGLPLTRDQIETQLQRLAAMTLAQRKQLAGLSAGRADIIVAGACIVLEIMERFGATRLQVCDRGVRWGLLWETAPRK